VLSRNTAAVLGTEFMARVELCKFSRHKFCVIFVCTCFVHPEWSYHTMMNFTRSEAVNPLTPNDHYSGRTAPLNSKRCILYIYSTNICTEYFKHGMYSSFFSLQNAVCFIILTCLVPVLFTFYIFIQQI